MEPSVRRVVSHLLGSSRRVEGGPSTALGLPAARRDDRRWLVVLRYVGGRARTTRNSHGGGWPSSNGFVTRSAGTRRIPTDDHSVAPPNVAWWPPRWPIEDVSDGSRTRRRALPGVLQLFKCATCQIQEAPCSAASVRTADNGLGKRNGAMSDGEPKLDEVAERLVAEGWYKDPYGKHDDRWLSAGEPTSLVRDAGIESRDPPPDTPLPTTLVPSETSNQASDGDDLRRADDAEREPPYDRDSVVQAELDAFPD